MRKYIKNIDSLEQYYTKREISKQCISAVFDNIPDDIDIFFEPSAGDGSFSDQLMACHNYIVYAIDINPKNNLSIMKMDFFKVSESFFSSFSGKKVCCIGNPPFGRNSSMAVKFFNYSAKFSDYISFVLPKTFRKESIQNRLDPNFHLIYDQDMIKNSFLFNDKEIDVPSVFQIWRKRKEKRDIKISKKETSYFSFSSKEKCDLAVRRVGGRTGKVFENIEDLSIQSNYFIKLINIDKQSFKDIMKSIDFTEIINNTAGVRSLSKCELISLFEERLNYAEDPRK